MKSDMTNNGSFCIMNHDNRIIYCNDLFEVIIGLPNIKIIGKKLSQILSCTVETVDLSHLGVNSEARGLLFCSQTQRYFNYKADHPTVNTNILFIDAAYPKLESFLQEFYPLSFHINPGLAAITLYNTGYHIDVNSSWLKALGYEKNEIIGKTSHEIGIWHDINIREKITSQLKKAGYVDGLKTALRKKNGEVVEVIINARVFEHKGILFCFFSSLDISSITQYQKKSEELESQINQIKQESLLDPLTNIGNRRQLDLKIKELWKISNKYSYPVSALMIDIDYFKAYNDLYGHIEGDKVIKSIASAIKKQLLRNEDHVCRYGGEEFVCLLGNTYHLGALSVAKRIMDTIAKLNIPHRTSEVSSHVTVSIGLSTLFPNRGHDLNELLTLADKHLYHAKESGRNKVESGVRSQESGVRSQENYSEYTYTCQLLS